MQFPKAVGWIAVTALLFAGIGALVGWVIGTYMPSYYRSTSLGGSDPNFDPVATGLGQGLTQGMVLGSAVGLVLILATWWKEAQLATLASMHASMNPSIVASQPAVSVEPVASEDQVRLGS